MARQCAAGIASIIMLSRQLINKRRNLYQTLDKVLGALKALAYVESRKLQQQAPLLGNISSHMQRAVQRLQPAVVTQSPKHPALLIAIGSERGFCGDLNSRILAELEQLAQPDTLIVCVGEKLRSRAEQRDMLFLNGANSSEDIEQVIDAIVSELLQLPATVLTNSFLLYNSELKQRIDCLSLLPDARESAEALMYVPAPQLLQQLLPLYLFALLNSVLSDALLAENKQRLDHLESAVNHLDESMNTLNNSANRLRQATIIEGIEASLLAGEGVGEELPDVAFKQP